MDNISPLCFATSDDWRTWLEHNHDKVKEVWLVHYKKGKAGKGISYFEALEEALCFGWIDSKLKRLDDDRFVLRYSPRNPKSVWSLGNREKVEALIASGRMAPAGLAAVEAARKNGRWDSAYTDREALPVPDDLRDALDGNRDARGNFERFATSRRNMYVRWVDSARTETTRQRRIAEVVERAASNQTPGDQKPEVLRLEP